jgi:hypothetical protein
MRGPSRLLRSIFVTHRQVTAVVVVFMTSALVATSSAFWLVWRAASNAFAAAQRRRHSRA